jgi:putative hydrolase of the HAD superfamily
MHAPITAIIFDYGKVLSLPPTEQQWHRLASVFGADQPAFQAQYWGFRDGYDRGEYNGADYWRMVADAFGKNLTEPEIKQLINWDNDQWTNENPDMLDFVRRSHAKGIRTAILSNMQREMLAFMRGKFPWLYDGIFDAQVYSCEIGIVKPDAESYLETCRRIAAQPANTLFLDDKQHNIDGAHHAGLQALLFTGSRAEVEKYMSNGSHR